MAPPNFCVDLETFFGDRHWIPHLAFFFVGFLIGRIFGWKKQLGSEAKWKKKPILGKGLQKKRSQSRDLQGSLNLPSWRGIKQCKSTLNLRKISLTVHCLGW